MTAIITITAEISTIHSDIFYDYSGEDRILKNIISGDYEVLYSGQNQGRIDHKLEQAVNFASQFRVYYRIKKSSSFIFLGSTNYSSIVKERIAVKGLNSLPHERLQIRIVIPAVNIEQITINTTFEGYGCHKKSVLQHSNFPINLNTNLGFYTKI